MKPKWFAKIKWGEWREWLKSPVFKLLLGCILLGSSISWESLHSLMALKMELKHGIGFIGLWNVTRGLAYLYKYFGFFLDKKKE